MRCLLFLAIFIAVHTCNARIGGRLGRWLGAANAPSSPPTTMLDSLGNDSLYDQSNQPGDMNDLDNQVENNPSKLLDDEDGSNLPDDSSGASGNPAGDDSSTSSSSGATITIDMDDPAFQLDPDDEIPAGNPPNDITDMDDPAFLLDPDDEIPAGNPPDDSSSAPGNNPDGDGSSSGGSGIITPPPTGDNTTMTDFDEPTAAPILPGVTLSPAYGNSDVVSGSSGSGTDSSVAGSSSSESDQGNGGYLGGSSSSGSDQGNDSSMAGSSGSGNDAASDQSGQGDDFFNKSPTAAPVLGGATMPPAYLYDDDMDDDEKESPTLAPSFAAPSGAYRPSINDYHYPTSYGIPTQKPVAYVATDDDPLQNAEEKEKGELNSDGEDFSIGDYVYFDHKEDWEDMEHDSNVAIALGVTFGVGLCLALIAAHQMLENPGGCCASICRLFVACNCFFVKCVCFPCRLICCRSDNYSNELAEGGRYSQRRHFDAELELT